MGIGGVKVGEGGEGTVPCGGSNIGRLIKRMFKHVSKEKIFSNTMYY
jgi:hypothetical protein